jgi:pimeloyl-ACP methyl ester carboxylesterase
VKLKTNGVELYYELHGDGEPIVFSHGWMCDHTQWSSQVDFFSRNHRVVTYDHRGHGKSDKPETCYSVQTLADDLRSLMDCLDLAGAALVGHSMGGMASLVLATEHYERISKMVLVDTTAKNDFSIYARLGIESFIRSDESLANWMVDLAHRDPSEQVRRETLARASNTPKSIAKECLTEFMTHYDVRDKLSNIKVPTLIVVGEKDEMTPVRMARFLNKGIRGSRLEIIPGSKHMPMIDDAAEFNKVLAGFVE